MKQSLYERIWGTPPPEGRVSTKVSHGIFEEDKSPGAARVDPSETPSFEDVRPPGLERRTDLKWTVREPIGPGGSDGEPLSEVLGESIYELFRESTSELTEKVEGFTGVQRQLLESLKEMADAQGQLRNSLKEMAGDQGDGRQSVEELTTFLEKAVQRIDGLEQSLPLALEGHWTDAEARLGAVQSEIDERLRGFEARAGEAIEKVGAILEAKLEKLAKPVIKPGRRSRGPDLVEWLGERLGVLDRKLATLYAQTSAIFEAQGAITKQLDRQRVLIEDLFAEKDSAKDSSP